MTSRLAVAKKLEIPDRKLIYWEQTGRLPVFTAAGAKDYYKRAKSIMEARRGGATLREVAKEDTNEVVTLAVMMLRELLKENRELMTENRELYEQLRARDRAEVYNVVLRRKVSEAAPAKINQI